MLTRLYEAFSLSLLVWGIGGCDLLGAESDDKLTAALVGSWYGEAIDPDSNAKIEVLIKLMPEGKFTATRRLTDAQRPPQVDIETGEWFVSNSFYRRRTNSLNSKRLERAEQSYSTCRIESVTNNEWTCVNGISNVIENRRRVAEDFKLP